MAILIDNGLIVTGDTAGSRFEPGGVLIEDDRIAWVGPTEEAPEAARGARPRHPPHRGERVLYRGMAKARQPQHHNAAV